MTEAVHRSGVAAGSGIVAVSVITEWFSSHSLQDITILCAVCGLLLNTFTSIPRIVESYRVLRGLVRPMASTKGKP